MGTGSFLGVKRSGNGVDYPPPSSAEVKERVELYLYSPSGPSWPFLWRTLLYFTLLYFTLLYFTLLYFWCLSLYKTRPGYFPLLLCLFFILELLHNAQEIPEPYYFPSL